MLFLQRDILRPKIKTRHVKRKHSDAINDNFKCSSCDCVFIERDSLNRHVKECHSPLATFENSAKGFECPIETCDKGRTI